jgi:hypothetical protein
MKGHYAQNWTNLYAIEDVPVASGSQYTLLLYSVRHYSNAPDAYVLGDIETQFPAGAQVDFQVEAMIGYCHRILQGDVAPWYFTGEESGWSNTQTITIPASVSPSPTSTPVPEFPSLTILLLLTIMVATAGLLVYHKKHKRSLVTA